ncbi:MAG: glycosyltransferase [Pseudomonadota bacterium]
MNDLNLRLPDSVHRPKSTAYMPIGSLLVEDGKIAQKDLRHALNLQKRIDAPLGDIMVSEGLVKKRDVLSALAVQARAQGADLERNPPSAEMANRLTADICLKYGVVPWREDERALYVATSSPAEFAKVRAAVGPLGAQLFPVIVDEAQIQTHQSKLYGKELAGRALGRVPEEESCRSWERRGHFRMLWAISVLGALAYAITIAPAWTFTAFIIWAIITLLMTSSLKAAALLACLRGGFLKHNAPTKMQPFRMPRVSILVPLLKEREIAGQLIARLSKLTYPKSLLNVVLVLEENDQLTRETIARTELPNWMSVIEVPQNGSLTTKPRALNYALDFCKGSIIGVWDAEDWPEPDQIEKVVSRFHEAPEDVACLQGVLDYYNSRSSFLSRCFTIEYAIWWRIVMPGMARLGLVVPLGGTTLFFKRDILEKLGGWDAHNVTEDADLGVRLARHGYKTELLATVTREEATSRVWAWVRQRSRWLKGFLVTYCVHMRRPGKLMRDIGFWRFLGIQTIFLAAVSQFAAAPVLWSFWLTLLGAAHPLEMTLGTGAVIAAMSLFIASELLSFILGVTAVSGRDHRHLIPFLPGMMLYFMLGAFAAYKAVWELIWAPFFWDKTQHGVSRQTDPTPKTSRRDAG